jgi:hypothetical protein
MDKAAPPAGVRLYTRMWVCRRMYASTRLDACLARSLGADFAERRKKRVWQPLIPAITPYRQEGRIACVDGTSSFGLRTSPLVSRR